LAEEVGSWSAAARRQEERKESERKRRRGMGERGGGWWGCAGRARAESDGAGEVTFKGGSGWSARQR
jgi:hypothetical protein